MVLGKIMRDATGAIEDGYRETRVIYREANRKKIQENSGLISIGYNSGFFKSGLCINLVLPALFG